MESVKDYQLSRGTYIINFESESLIYNKNNFQALKLSKKATNYISRIFDGNPDSSPSNDFNKLLLILIAKGLLNEKEKTGQNKKHPVCVIKNSTNPHLNRVMIEITNECNLKCRHCYVLARKSKPRHLPLKIIINLITELEKIGVWQIDLTGGEISVHPDIIKILNRLRDTHLLVNLFSNLSTNNKKFIQAVIATKPKLVVTSIDGNTATLHDGFRRVKGAFKRTVESIKFLQEKNIPVRVNISLSKYNYQNLGKIVNFVKTELKTPFIIGDIQCTDPVTREIMLSRDKVIKSIIKYQSDIYSDRKKDKTINFKKVHPACGVAFDFCFINSSGEVSLCPTLTKNENDEFFAGSIFDNQLYDIWQKSKTFKKYFGSQCKDIENCSRAIYCKGGCRSRSYLENKNINDKDPVNCSIVTKLF